ncbi:MAG: hypothetical protein KFKLKKLM_00328 [Flavobacteriales bacterium]|nr:hypothetical protein [Flavobacteriales bacterium]
MGINFGNIITILFCLLLHTGCVFKRIVVLDSNKYDIDYKDNKIINYEMYFSSKKVIKNIEEMTFRDRLQLKNEAYRCKCDTIYVDLERNFGDTLEIINYQGWEESNHIGVFYFGLANSEHHRKKYNKKQLKQPK